MRGSLPRRGLTLPVHSTEEEPNRYCSVGGNGLKLYSNGRLSIANGCNRASQYRTGYVQPGASDSDEPLESSPSPYLRQGPKHPVHCRSCVSRQNRARSCVDKLFWWPHSDRHPQPVHKATLRLRAKRRIGKNSLLQLFGYIFAFVHDGPQIPRSPSWRSEHKSTEPPHESGSLSALMASHWPPEKTSDQGSRPSG
jgi:hypothetical protein